MAEVVGLARSGAGHDKGTLYAVLETTEKTALLTDGRLRKLARPKRKNRKHVEFLPDSEFAAVEAALKAARTDAAIRRALGAYRAGCCTEIDQGGT